MPPGAGSAGECGTLLMMTHCVLSGQFVTMALPYHQHPDIYDKPARDVGHQVF